MSKNREQIPASPAQSDAGKNTNYRSGLAYGRFIYRMRWPVLIVWLLLLGACFPLILKLGSVLQGSFYSDSTSESSQVSQIISNKLNQPDTQLLIVFQSGTTPVNATAYQQEVQHVATQVQSFPHVSSVLNAGTGKDGTSTFLVVNFDKQNDINQQLNNFQKLLPQGSAQTPARVYLAGGPESNQEYITTLLKETVSSKAIALPIALLVLMIVFGSLISGLMPLLLSLAAVTLSLALIAFIGRYVSTNVFVLSVVAVTGFGISIDYSLFIVRRFREELARGKSKDDAISWAVATAGEAILFSGLTVMIGFAGLLVLRVSFLNSFGLGGLVVVGSAVLAALTLLPAILSILGAGVNALRIPFLSRFVGVEPRKKKEAQLGGQTQSRATGGFWHGWAIRVMRRPVLVLIAVCVVLVALGWPVFSLNIGTPDTNDLPKGTQSYSAYTILAAQFPSFSDRPVEIIAQTTDGSSVLSAANLAKVANLTQWLKAQAHVTGVTSLTSLPTQAGSAQPNQQQLLTLYSTGAYQQSKPLAQFVAATTIGNTTLIKVEDDAKIDSSEGKALITHLRADHTAAAQGLTVLVGGYQASSLDFTNYLYGNFPLALIFILGSTFILLAIMFRSLLIPLKAIVMNVLSIGVAYGVLVFIFQWGHLQSVFNFTATSFIDSPVPVLLFCTLFGLSMDYEVFLLSRIREEWLHTGDNTQAVALGLEKTAGTITNAALLFILFSGSALFTSLITTQEYGLGLTVAVLIDSTIIRVLLVPATMRLLGNWNWWPGRKPQAQASVPVPASEQEAVEIS
jgi:putative drug exporter of the RND superfamily